MAATPVAVDVDVDVDVVIVGAGPTGLTAANCSTTGVAACCDVDCAVRVLRHALTNWMAAMRVRMLGHTDFWSTVVNSAWACPAYALAAGATCLRMAFMKAFSIAASSARDCASANRAWLGASAGSKNFKKKPAPSSTRATAISPMAAQSGILPSRTVSHKAAWRAKPLAAAVCKTGAAR